MEDQVEQHQTWWQKNKQLIIVAVVVVAIILLIAFALAVYWFGWNWTGFYGGESKVTKTPQGTNTEYSLGKTLWDWMQLLLVPIMLAIGGFSLNQIQRGREQRTTEQRANLERELTRDNQRENLLQAYIGQMSELLLEKNLRESDPKDYVRTIARARTLTVLPKLNGNRKRSVLLFLHEAGLLGKGALPPIIGLWEADFSQARLNHTHLREVSLTKADLREANLNGAYLNKAHLSGAYLINADLRDADLRDADLSAVDPEFKGAKLDGANLRGAKLDGANLRGAEYNKKAMQEKNEQGQLITDERGDPVMIEPTQWPQGFDPTKKEVGLICVDC